MLKPLTVYLYSDASRFNDKCCTTSIVMTDTTYLGYVNSIILTTKTSRAEIIAIQKGLDYIDKLDLDIQKIIVYSDFIKASKVFNKYKRGIRSNTKEDRNWNKIFQLAEKYDIEICHYARSKKRANTIMTCDIYSRKTLQL